MAGLLLALLVSISPAFAGKKDAAPPPAAAPAAAPAVTIDPAFEADIRRLLEMTGSAALGQQVMDQMMLSLRPMAPEVPQSFWDEMAREIDVDELVDRIVPVYAAHLTHDEVKQLVAFFDSPVGRRLVAEQPAMLQESMQIGQVWGAEVGERVIRRMQEQR
jgi:hypothetical protein